MRVTNIKKKNQPFYASARILSLAVLLTSFFLSGCLLGDDIETLRQKAGFPVDYVIPGDSLMEKFNWLSENAVNGGSYIIEAEYNETLSGLERLGYNNMDVTITLKGGKTEKTINLSDNYRGSMFIITNMVTLILDNNITLIGHNNNSRALISVDTDSTLIMNAGVKITGNTNSDEYYSGGGIIIKDGGTFTMNGGTISVNSATLGGGVYLENGTFTMNGGTILKNTADNGSGYGNGGGVYIGSGVFDKTGGLIFGSSGGNTAASVGHAVCAYDLKYRNDNVITNLSYNTHTGSESGIWNY